MVSRDSNIYLFSDFNTAYTNDVNFDLIIYVLLICCINKKCPEIIRITYLGMALNTLILGVERNITRRDLLVW